MLATIGAIYGEGCCSVSIFGVEQDVTTTFG